MDLDVLPPQHDEHIASPQEDEMAMPGGPMVGENLLDSTESFLATIEQQLADEGEPVDSGWLRRQFGDDRLAEGLAKVEALGGAPAREYVRHSYRFSQLEPHSYLGETVTIEPGFNNQRANGADRRSESGSRVLLDKVAANGVDPSKVLYYRVTQPSAQPKPEYYWTSDSLETRTGLRKELGGGHRSAVILVSTLETIARNEGLKTDINDDAGVAVRQIGLGPFDQRQVLFAFSRSTTELGVIAPESLHSDEPDTPESLPSAVVAPLDPDANEDVW